jgi:protein-S-isoprenylcysteine O-methyltransferase Ste14
MKGWLSVLLPLVFFSALFAPDIASEVGGYFQAFGLVFLSFVIIGGIWWVSETHKENKELKYHLRVMAERYESDTGKKPPRLPFHLSED